MKRVFLLVCLLAMTGTAFAGFSIGFTSVEVPWMVNGTNGFVEMEDMYLVRLGAMASTDFRIEGYVGYEKQTYELDPQTAGTIELTGSGTVFGAGRYYIIAAPANTSFSIGARFLYCMINVDGGTSAVPVEYETTSYAIDPLIRVDFAIPGAERLAFFTEYGFRYAKATMKTTAGGVAGTTDDVWSGLATYAPPNILAGVYYIF